MFDWSILFLYDYLKSSYNTATFYYFLILLSGTIFRAIKRENEREREKEERANERASAREQVRSRERKIEEEKKSRNKLS